VISAISRIMAHPYDHSYLLNGVSNPSAVFGPPGVDGGHVAPQHSLFSFAPPSFGANRVQTTLAASYGHADDIRPS
jgi:hypothetical protein